MKMSIKRFNVSVFDRAKATIVHFVVDAESSTNAMDAVKVLFPKEEFRYRIHATQNVAEPSDPNQWEIMA